MIARERLSLDDHIRLLDWLGAAHRQGTANLDELSGAPVCLLAALAAMARTDSQQPIRVHASAVGALSRFAFALGFQHCIDGGAQHVPREQDRTVSLTRVKGAGPQEPLASAIVQLLIPSSAPIEELEARNLFQYVLVELLRNVVQHSNDPLGGVVAAQINTNTGRPATLQVVVADNGIGVFEGLHRMRPNLDSPEVALVAALDPHVSGAFPEGETGSRENAGMGLFFISEMAKLTEGRLLLASRGASLFLDRTIEDQPRFEHHQSTGFPGTLVVFETALSHVHAYDGIMERIRDAARTRTPKRASSHWLRYNAAPADARRFVIGVAKEDTERAARLSEESLQPLILKKTPVILDFLNIQVCTQSFLHALLYEAIRLAWAKKSPVYVTNTTPAVRFQLDTVENYSLGG